MLHDCVSDFIFRFYHLTLSHFYGIIYIAKKLGCYVQVGKMEMGTKLWNAEKYYLQMGCQTILL